MLRIMDARTGRQTPAAPSRRAPTRVEAHAPVADATALRVLLVTDLLVRALELDGTPAWASLTGAPDPERLRAQAAALGVRPFEDGAAGSGPGTVRTVHVLGEGGTAPDGAIVAVAAVAAVHPDGPGREDPDALRLALLERHHHARVELDEAVLATARNTLAHWRTAVARWARQPSRPVPADVRERLRAAREDDLDAPAVLRILRGVESDPELPDGARFEICAYADRFLGLQLTRDVGAPE
ncbi:hypothetical protein ACFUIW_29830 [Streptomyces sp. NPDC057245]|uniref:hypothetical protein n=1 Tax=Streptomyces sp. NPDC057245 TaxID=3346065 RepID=UPI00362C3048